MSIPLGTLAANAAGAAGSSRPLYRAMAPMEAVNCGKEL